MPRRAAGELQPEQRTPLVLMTLALVIIDCALIAAITTWQIKHTLALFGETRASVLGWLVGAEISTALGFLIGSAVGALVVFRGVLSLARLTRGRPRFAQFELGTRCALAGLMTPFIGLIGLFTLPFFLVAAGTRDGMPIGKTRALVAIYYFCWFATGIAGRALAETLWGLCSA